MKTFQTVLCVGAQAAKKYLAVMALASVASFTSLGSLALFAQAAHADTATTTSAGGKCGEKRTARQFGGEQDHPRLGAKLELSDAQKAILSAARATNKASQIELHEKLRSAHSALDKASTANADDALLNKLASDLASLMAQRELTRAKAHRDFLNVLTPEQTQKLDTLAAEAKNSPRGLRGYAKRHPPVAE